jgi:secretion/DNA translocation related TadE-like protein
MMIIPVLFFAGVILAGGYGLFEFHRAQKTTDNAALDAADAASGLIAGYPCDLADDHARSAGIALTRCDVEGLVSRVVMNVTILGIDVQTRAKAGPRYLSED